MFVIKNNVTGAYLRSSRLGYLAFDTLGEAKMYIRQRHLNPYYFDVEWMKDQQEKPAKVEGEPRKIRRIFKYTNEKE